MVFTLGLFSTNFWPALLVHLLLSYPTGYLDRRSRIVVIAGYVDTLGVSLLLLPFSQPRLDGQGADRLRPTTSCWSRTSPASSPWSR